MRKRKLDVTKRVHKLALLELHYPFIHNSFRADWLIWARILKFDWQMIVSLFVLQVDWLNDCFIFVFKLDFDECGGNNNHCHQNAICTNTIGSYSCRCSVVSLFVLQVDGLNDCFIFFLKLDFDECGGDNKHCHQNAICTNNIGSYSCRCSVGYAGDGLLCRGIKFEAPSCSFSFNSWSIIIKGNSSNGKQTSLVSLRLARIRYNKHAFTVKLRENLCFK